jgi:hypothetical protein
VTFDEALDQFAAGRSVLAQREAARHLLRGTTLHKASKDQRFKHGLEVIRDRVRREDTVPERLEALALYVRIGSGLRYKAKHDYYTTLLPLMRTPLGALSSLEDPDDRYYAAWALRWIDEPWATAELARLAVEEEADNVRREALKGLVERALTLHEALEQLLEAAAGWKPGTESPATTQARRMRRVFVQLADVIESARSAQPQCGALIARLARPPGGRVEDVDASARDQLADSALQLVHLLLRVRFSLAADERTYEALTTLKAWFVQPMAWSRFAAKSDAAPVLARDLEQAIEMLAKQGKGDEQLVARLKQLVGEEEVRRRLGAVADESSGIPPELREWLRTGQVARTSSKGDPNAALVEDAKRGADVSTLAMMLRDAEGARQLAASAAEDALPEIEIFAPRSAAAVKDLGARLRVLTQQVESLAARRGLRTRGERGQVLEYAPLEHEIVGEGQVGVRWVRIVEPAVEQVVGDRADVVVKALVVPAAPPQS